MSIFSDSIKSYIREKQEKKGQPFCPATWIDAAANRASQIAVATHVLKFTHSDAKGTNIDAPKDQNHPCCYLSTDSFNEVENDVIGNAAAMDVAAFLSLKEGNDTLLDVIASDDSSPLAPYAKSESQLSLWMNGFKQVLSSGKCSSHNLARQVYFPISENEYHLLAPLYASSLAHAFFSRIREDRFGKKAKEARERRKKGLFSDDIVIDYPNLAIQTFGGTNQQNISRLNSKRGGRSYLLCSAPPKWLSTKNPPKYEKDFWNSYGKSVFILINDYRSFLLSNSSPTNREVRFESECYRDQFFDLLMSHAAEIQAMPSGWSQHSCLSLSEQLWLDPGREDEEFQRKRSTEEWKKEIAERFARWLRNRLEYKNRENRKIKLEDEEFHELKSHCLKVLKEVD